MHRYNPQNLGEFQEQEFGNWFTYRKTNNTWALSQGLEFEIDVGDGVRFAKVLKTVAHVCCNEGDSGVAITEPWKIKKHNIYPER